MPTDTDPSTRPPRRRLPLRYFIGALVCVFALPVLMWVIWGSIESWRLDRTLDALEARREPLDIADFDLKPTTPEQREASHLYAQARKLVAGLPITSQETVALGTAIEQACDSDAGPHGQADILRAFEERYTAVFDLLDRASRLDVSGWDDADRPGRASMEEMQSLALARANVVRIASRACTGDVDGAASALFSTLRLRRLWYPGPVLTPTAHSLHAILSWGSLSAELLAQLQREFASLADDRVFEKWMVRQRAYWLFFTMPGVFSEEPPGFEARKISPIEFMMTRLVRPLRDHRAIVELAEYDEAIEVSKRAWPQKIDDVRSFIATHRANSSQSIHRGIVESLTRPFGVHAAAGSMNGYFDAITETLARNRASVGVIAVARYRRDHNGQLPTTLQQLGEPYLSTPLIDPYTGTELRYWHDCSGFKVYSVGVNRKDDGGSWEQHSDLQLSRRGNPADIGIEVGRWPRGCAP